MKTRGPPPPPARRGAPGGGGIGLPDGPRSGAPRRIEDARIDTVISEVDLEHLASAPAYERQRWAEPLVRAVLDRYRLDAHAGSLWIYVPR